MQHSFCIEDLVASLDMVRARKHGMIHAQTDKGFFQYCHDKSMIYLDTIYVEPTLRGQGYGRELYERALKRGRDIGCNKLLVSVAPVLYNSTELLKLFLKNGLELYSSGLNIIFLVKDI